MEIVIDTSKGTKTVKAQQLEFTPKSEPFQVYILEDGTKLKIRVKIKSVHRILDDSMRNAATHEPAYRIEYDVDMNTITPKSQ